MDWCALPELETDGLENAGGYAGRPATKEIIMTQRLNGFVVHLDTALRDDDCEDIIAAISMIKGVANVTPVLASGISDMIVAGRVKRELLERIEAVFAEGGNV